MSNKRYNIEQTELNRGLDPNDPKIQQLVKLQQGAEQFSKLADNYGFYRDYAINTGQYFKQIDTDLVDPSFGTSRHDDKITDISQAYNGDLTDFRAKDTGAIETIGKGVGGFAVNLLGTVAQTFALPVGALAEGAMQLGSLLVNPSNPYKGSGNHNLAYDLFYNPLSNKVNELQDKGTEYFNIDRTIEEQNNNWVKNIGLHPLNFIFGDVAPAAGFTVGAMLGGEIGAVGKGTSLVGKAANAIKNNKAFLQRGKDLGIAVAELGKKGSDDIIKNIMSHNSKEIADWAKEYAKRATLANKITTWNGAITAAMTEANVEGYHARKEYLDVTMKGVDEYFNSQSFQNKLLNNFKANPEGCSSFEEYSAKKYKETQDSVVKTADSIGLSTMAMNTAFLSLSNKFLWDSFFNPEFKMSSRINPKLNGFIKPVLGSDGTLEGVERTALSKGKKTWLYSKVPLGEANEEMFQSFMSNFNKGYYGDKMNEQFFDAYEEILNPENHYHTYSIAQSLADAFAKSYGNGDVWKEGLIGGIMGAVGLPKLGMKTTSNGNQRLGITGWNSGFSEVKTEIQESNKLADNIVKRFRNASQDKKEVIEELRKYISDGVIDNNTNDISLEKLGIIKTTPNEMLSTVALINSLNKRNPTLQFEQMQSKLMSAITQVNDIYTDLGCSDIITSFLNNISSKKDYTKLSADEKNIFDELIDNGVLSGMKDAFGNPIQQELDNISKQELLDEVSTNAKDIKSFIDLYNSTKNSIFKAFYQNFAEDSEPARKLKMLASEFAKASYLEEQLINTSTILSQIKDLNELPAYREFISSRFNGNGEMISLAFDELRNQIADELGHELTDDEDKSLLAETFKKTQIDLYKSYIMDMLQHKNKFVEELRNAELRFSQNQTKNEQQETISSLGSLLQESEYYTYDVEQKALDLLNSLYQDDFKDLKTLAYTKDIEEINKRFNLNSDDQNKEAKQLQKYANKLTNLKSIISRLEKLQSNSNSARSQGASSILAELINKPLSEQIDTLYNMSQTLLTKQSISGLSAQEQNMLSVLNEFRFIQSLTIELNNIASALTQANYTSSLVDDKLQTENKRKYILSLQEQRFKDEKAKKEAERKAAEEKKVTTQTQTTNSNLADDITPQDVEVFNNKDVFNAYIDYLQKAYNILTDPVMGAPMGDKFTNNDKQLTIILHPIVGTYIYTAKAVLDKTNKTWSISMAIADKGKHTEVMSKTDLPINFTVNELPGYYDSEQNAYYPLAFIIHPQLTYNDNIKIGEESISSDELTDIKKESKDFIDKFNTEKQQLQSNTPTSDEIIESQEQIQQVNNQPLDTSGNPINGVYLSDYAQDILDSLNKINDLKDVEKQSHFAELLQKLNVKANSNNITIVSQQLSTAIRKAGFVKDTDDIYKLVVGDFFTSNQIISNSQYYRFMPNTEIAVEFSGIMHKVTISKTNDSGNIIEAKTDTKLTNDNSYKYWVCNNGVWKSVVDNSNNPIIEKESTVSIRQGWSNTAVSQYDTYTQDSQGKIAVDASGNKIINNRATTKMTDEYFANSKGNKYGKAELYNEIRTVNNDNNVYSVCITTSLAKGEKLGLKFSDNQLKNPKAVEQLKSMYGKYTNLFKDGVPQLVGIYKLNDDNTVSDTLLGILDPINTEVLAKINTDGLENTFLQNDGISFWSSSVFITENPTEKNTLSNIDPNSEALYVIKLNDDSYISNKGSLTNEQLQELLGLNDEPNLTPNTMYMFSPTLARDKHPRQKYAMGHNSQSIKGTGEISASEFPNYIKQGLSDISDLITAYKTNPSEELRVNTNSKLEGYFGNFDKESNENNNVLFFTNKGHLNMFINKQGEVKIGIYTLAKDSNGKNHIKVAPGEKEFVLDGETINDINNQLINSVISLNVSYNLSKDLFSTNKFNDLKNNILTTKTELYEGGIFFKFSLDGKSDTKGTPVAANPAVTEVPVEPSTETPVEQPFEAPQIKASPITNKKLSFEDFETEFYNRANLSKTKVLNNVLLKAKLPVLLQQLYKGTSGVNNAQLGMLTVALKGTGVSPTDIVKWVTDFQSQNQELGNNCK